MKTTTSSQNNSNLREHLVDAVRYWEKRRVPYNLVLSAIVIGWFLLTWPHFQTALNIHDLSVFAVLGLLANVCYSVVYLVDIPMQHSSFGNFWRHKRWILWLIGLGLAILFTNHWIADEIYPYINQ